MNTQRPEWNDANNALVGNGVSMVTLYYLRRFFNFFEDLLSNTSITEIDISNELYDFFNKVLETFENNKDLLENSINDRNKKQILDALGLAGSHFRMHIYNHAFSGRKSSLSVTRLKEFISISKLFLEHSIRFNKRSDNLYHAYNLVTIYDDALTISNLSEMLEGQVAALSSGYLSANEVLDVLNALKESKLFREDQYSYLLYPNKKLKGFLDRNTIPKDAVSASKLMQELVNDGHVQIIQKDVNGDCHFNGNFKNANDVSAELNKLVGTKYETFLKTDRQKVLQAFEDVNKRVSRLAANIPLIRDNLSPLSFVDVPQDIYISALLAIYEFNRIDLMRDVFVWAYKRSASLYSATQQSLGNPDPFRMQYYSKIQSLIHYIVKSQFNKQKAHHYIAEEKCKVPSSDQEKLVQVIETELLDLHEGNIARYKLSLNDYKKWQTQWTS